MGVLACRTQRAFGAAVTPLTLPDEKPDEIAPPPPADAGSAIATFNSPCASSRMTTIKFQLLIPPAPVPQQRKRVSQVSRSSPRIGRCSSHPPWVHFQ